jgi:hypothetical protein
MFINNTHSTREQPSTTETLKTIKQEHDESLWDYVKHFWNTRNAIPNIQDIKITNAFSDGVIDIKTVKKITMKKPKIVADLLPVADESIEAFEAQARLLDACNKGSAKK